MMENIIRQGSIHDIENLTNLMKKVYAPFFVTNFLSKYGMALNEKGFGLAATMAVNNPNKLVLVALSQEDWSIVGSIFGTIGQWHLNPNERFVELSHWCIDTEKAERTLGKKLYAKIEEWAKLKGAKCITISLMDDFEPTRKLATALGFFYGFDKQESIYMKGL